MNFKEAEKWLNSFSKHGIKLGLSRIQKIDEKLNNPHKNYKTIHVGGTNGKGSVSIFISELLQSHGFKTGVYTSPHLHDIRERIKIDNKKISENDFAKIASEIKKIIDELEQKKDPPTYFEIITAIAFRYFDEKKVDFAVFEVGLGGRYDATNIIKPVLSVITNVSLEHQKILGDTIDEISKEKAGIIKLKTSVVTAAKSNSQKIIKNTCKKKHCSITTITKDNWERTKQDLKAQTFLIKTKTGQYQVKTNMEGLFQGENIAIAINAFEKISQNNFKIKNHLIKQAIKKAYIPARMELIWGKPLILLDGAHNFQGIKKLVETIKSDFNFKKLITIIGILSDKNLKKMIPEIVKISDIIIFTRSHNQRATNPDILKNIAEKHISEKKKIYVRQNVKKSIDFAYKQAKKKDLICITGSLFTVSEAKEILKQGKLDS